MKDSIPEPVSSGLPPCSLSAQCVDMLDELDLFTASSSVLSDPVVDDVVGQNVRHLSSHLSTCETCLYATTHARRRREQQRRALRSFLVENETRVPSTTASILTAIRQEAASGKHTGAELPEIVTHDDVHILNLGKAPSRARKPFNYALRLFAVCAFAAALVLASIGFIRMRPSIVTTGTSSMKDGARTTPVTQPQVIGVSPNWSSVVSTTQDSSGLILTLYNADTGKQSRLLPSCCAPGVVMDGISRDGQDAVYHLYDPKTNTTAYQLISERSFEFTGRGQNAVWSTNSQYLFVATEAGVWRVTVATEDRQKLSATLQAATLAFARDQFLYFYRADRTLYRVDVTVINAKPELVLAEPSASVFGLDPNDRTLYYTLVENGQRNVYLRAEGSEQSTLLTKNATLVGYAPDFAPLVVTRDAATSQFQLRKVDRLQKTSTVVMSDLVNGATSLCAQPVSDPAEAVCESSIALFSDRLMIVAGFADGSHKLYAINWQQPTNRKELSPLPATPHTLQLIGWSKLQLS